jgi:hypothetical protein
MPRWLVDIRIVFLALILAAAMIIVCRDDLVAGELANKRPKGSAQALWVTNLGTFSVLEGSALTHSGKPRPTLVFGNPADYSGGLTFDGDGNLWGTVIGDPSFRGTSFIFKLTPAQLRKLVNHEKVKPAIEIDNAGGAALHFDSAGNLWVASPPSEFSNLVMYSPDQLVSGPAPTPARNISFVFGIGNITDFAFDSSGNIWLDSDYSADHTQQTGLAELTPDQFAASGYSIVPHLVLVGAAGKALAFDSSGNLWAATEAGIYMYPPSALTGAGYEAGTPAVVIHNILVGEGTSFSDPDGLAFDALGNLWVASSTDVGGRNYGGIVELAADQLASSGSPRPIVLLKANRRETNLTDPSLITFGPRLK